MVDANYSQDHYINELEDSNSEELDIFSGDPRIAVVGVGGAGSNAVNNMIESSLNGVDFVVANTDAQAIRNSIAAQKLQLGASATKGLGAGSHPEVGCSAAEESHDEIANLLEGNNMVFITAGMGGGTGTGASPVIANIAREMGILTVAVVTKPFMFEGVHRMKIANAGIEELGRYVDTLIVIPNQNLFRISSDKTSFAEAFKIADKVLYDGVRSVTDLITMPGLINLDFADISTVMKGMGKAMMGTGESSGENRAIEAAELAISNPLLDCTSMKGAQGVLINITGGMDMTLFEVDEAANRIKEEVEENTNIIFGSALNSSLDKTIRVSVVAAGIEDENSNFRSYSSTKLFENNSKITGNGKKLENTDEATHLSETKENSDIGNKDQKSNFDKESKLSKVALNKKSLTTVEEVNINDTINTANDLREETNINLDNISTNHNNLEEEQNYYSKHDFDDYYTENQTRGHYERDYNTDQEEHDNAGYKTKRKKNLFQKIGGIFKSDESSQEVDRNLQIRNHKISIRDVNIRNGKNQK